MMFRALFPEAVTLHSKGDLRLSVELKLLGNYLNMGKVSWLTQVGPVCSQKFLNAEDRGRKSQTEGWRWKSDQRDAGLLALKTGKRLQSKECENSLEAVQGKR